MKKNFVSIVFGGLIFAGTSGNAEAISLIEALIAAFQNGKEWAAKKTEKDTAAAKYKQSIRAFLPDVSAQISASRSRTDNKMTVPLNEETTDTAMSLRVNQNIFSGFSTFNTMKASKYAKTSAVYKLKNEEQKLVLEVTKAYMEIWLCRKTLDALKKQVENLQNTLKAQQSSLEAGMATPTDVAEAESKYQSAIYAKIDAETRLMTAVADFERLTELKADENMNPPEFLFELPKTTDALINQALKVNSAVLAGQMDEAAALKNLNAVKGELAPSVDATLIASKELNKVRSAKTGEREKQRETDPKRYSASLTVTVPIFRNQNGSNTYSRIEIANQEALKARFVAEETALRVKEECIVNWNKYQSAIAMIQASRAAVKSAELSSEGNAEETALGTKSNTDVWAKENNLLEARINLAKSQKERIMAAVTILSLIGELSLKSFVMNMRNWAKKQKLQRNGILEDNGGVKKSGSSAKKTPIKALKKTVVKPAKKIVAAANA